MHHTRGQLHRKSRGGSQPEICLAGYLLTCPRIFTKFLFQRISQIEIMKTKLASYNSLDDTETIFIANGYTYLGGSSTIFKFASFQLGSILKRISFHLSPRETNTSHRKWKNNLAVYPSTLAMLTAEVKKIISEFLSHTSLNYVKPEIATK